MPADYTRNAAERTASEIAAANISTAEAETKAARYRAMTLGVITDTDHLHIVQGVIARAKQNDRSAELYFRLTGTMPSVANPADPPSHLGPVTNNYLTVDINVILAYVLAAGPRPIESVADVLNMPVPSVLALVDGKRFEIVNGQRVAVTEDGRKELIGPVGGAPK